MTTWISCIGHFFSSDFDQSFNALPHLSVQGYVSMHFRQETVCSVGAVPEAAGSHLQLILFSDNVMPTTVIKHECNLA